jgi:hypothetical protein
MAKMNNENPKNFRYCEYPLPSGNSVILTPRPDWFSLEAVKVMTEKFKPKVRFQLTDDLVDYPEGPVFHWYPWFPGRHVPVELVYPCLMLLNKYNKTPGNIWMHCDFSSMRAPTFFGLFLHAVYPGQLDEICEPCWWTEDPEYNRHSDPRYYAKVSLRNDPNIKDFINAWVTGGEGMACDCLNKLPYRE